MARISFVLPMENYRTLNEVIEEAIKKYGANSKEYRHGLEAILLNYVEPQLRAKEPL